MSEKFNTAKEYKDCLRSYFLSIVTKTDITPVNELIEEFEVVVFPKNKLIYRAGGFSDSIYFICKGLVRVYYEKEGKEITNLFVTENNIVIGAYSIITGQKNYSNYEAFEETNSFKIKVCGAWKNIMQNIIRWNILARILVEKYYCAFMKKTYDVLFLSAEERYQLFIKDHSDLLNRVPLKHIATFLGIQKETLSRLRSKY
jgi:hypothetical protein